MGDRRIKENVQKQGETKKSILDAKLQRKDADSKGETLNKVLERERKQFQDECQKLKRQLDDQAVVSKEQEMSLGKEFGKGKNKKTFMVADEEEAFSEPRMHRRILKLSFLNTIQRRHIKQHQKNIEVFEQAFATIKSTTGISDIEEIVKIFVGLEQRNFSLLTYVNTLNRDIESIEKRNRDLRGQLEDYQKDQGEADAHKETAMKDLVLQITKTQAATIEKDKMVEESTTALQESRPLVWNIVSLLKRELPHQLELAYSGDAPPMRCTPPDEHEENLNKFLLYIEEAMMQFRICLPTESTRKKNDAPAKASAVGNFKKPADLPAAHIQGDDSDDDLETSLAERPLPRAELRERAQAVIQRRRKKGGAGGKAAHAVPDPVEEALADTSKREVAATTPKAEGALKDDAQSLPRAPQEGDEMGGSRDAMWWRGQGKEKKKS